MPYAARICPVQAGYRLRSGRRRRVPHPGRV